MDLIHRIHDVTTGEIIEKPFTKEEIADFTARQKAAAEHFAAEQAKQEAKQELLDKLGISADEAKLLFG